MNKQKAWKTFRATSLLFIVVIFICFTGRARAEYPEKPVTIVVGMEAGGLTDLITRALSTGASKALKQPIVIENKGGGGGSVAAGVIATAKPDGYTLGAVQNVSLIDGPIMQKVPFKPLKSFTPVTVFAWSEHSALLVNDDAPWKTFAEFIGYAKQNPGKVKYSISGLGTGMHVAMEVIARKDGIKWVAVPYKGGVGARTALMGKHVDACSYGVDWPAYVQPGGLRVLATHGKVRSPHSPNVPTLTELGYSFISGTLHSIIGPVGLPPDVVAKLETAFVKGMEASDFKTTVERLYLSSAYYNSKDYERGLAERWPIAEKTFKELGVIKEAATQPY